MKDIRINLKNTSYVLGFKGKNQLPLLMLIKEYYINNELEIAKVLFQINGAEYRKSMKEFRERNKVEWNNIFNMDRVVNGKHIIVGKQDIETASVLIKNDNGNIIHCPMHQNEDGEIYFIYDNTRVYISEYMGEFAL